MKKFCTTKNCITYFRNPKKMELSHCQDTSEWEPGKYNIVLGRLVEESENGDISEANDKENEAQNQKRSFRKWVRLDPDEEDKLKCRFEFEAALKILHERVHRQPNQTDGDATNNIFEQYSSSFALLAAGTGNFQMLKTCLGIAKENVVAYLVEKESNIKERIIGSNEEANLFSLNAISTNKETVLHLVLKRPCLDKKKETEVHGYMLYVDHMKCADVLFHSEHGLSTEALHEMINKQDREGNTPLHHAINSWPPKIIKKLLASGADISIENEEIEDAMSKIPPGLIKDYLDTDCVRLQSGNKERGVDRLIKGYTRLDENIQNSTNQKKITKFEADQILDEKVIKEILEGNDPSFMSRLNDDTKIGYNIGLLVPTLNSHKNDLRSDIGPTKQYNCK